MTGSYRSRRVAFARKRTAYRLGSRWSIASRAFVGAAGAAITYAVSTLFGMPTLSVQAALVAVMGGLGALGVWAIAVALYGYIAAPEEMDRELAADCEAQIEALRLELANARVAIAPEDAIRMINRHLDELRGIYQQVKTVFASHDSEAWTPPLRATVDWIARAGNLIEEQCVGRHHDFLRLWRSIPSEVREAGRNPDGSPYVNGFSMDVRGWMNQATSLLKGCISVIESRQR